MESWICHYCFVLNDNIESRCIQCHQRKEELQRLFKKSNLSHQTQNNFDENERINPTHMGSIRSAMLDQGVEESMEWDEDEDEDEDEDDIENPEDLYDTIDRLVGRYSVIVIYILNKISVSPKNDAECKERLYDINLAINQCKDFIECC